MCFGSCFENAGNQLCFRFFFLWERERETKRSTVEMHMILRQEVGWNRHKFTTPFLYFRRKKKEWERERNHLGVILLGTNWVAACTFSAALLWNPRPTNSFQIQFCTRQPVLDISCHAFVVFSVLLTLSGPSPDFCSYTRHHYRTSTGIFRLGWCTQSLQPYSPYNPR